MYEYYRAFQQNGDNYKKYQENWRNFIIKIEHKEINELSTCIVQIQLV